MIDRPARWIALAFLVVLLAPRFASALAAQTEPAQSLQAIFIEVDGKVRWRTDDKADWKDALVNDLVSPGAEIRTGLKGRAALRVGKNATVLVDAGTTFQLPSIVQDGETLRTLAAVKTGRVDFKVDKVGFANDFKVLTPQTTLSVRGTGFGISSGALAGVEVVGARTNAINAIELRYVTQNIRYFLSGSATSNSGRKDPVRNAWMSTIGPPQVAGTIVDAAQLEQTAAQGQTGNAPTSAQMVQQIAAAQSEERFGSVVLDLLRLEERAADRSNLATGATLVAAGVASGAAGDARDAVAQRNDHIDGVLQARDALETAWSGTGSSTSLRSAAGDQARLEAIRAQGDADLGTIADRRVELDTAILLGDENDVTRSLDSIGAVDDAWHGTLRVEAGNILAGLTALNAEIQQAYTLAEAKDGQFNALRPPAEAEVANTQQLAATLDGLRDTVRRYQAAVVAAVRAGKADRASILQLLRSVEILVEVEKRTTAALAASASAAGLLDEARSLSERVLLAAAFTAQVRGSVIQGLADGLKDDIDAKTRAIQLARFDAFYRSADAGLDAIDEGRDLAEAQASGMLPLLGAIATAAAPVKPMLQTSRQTSDALDAFWTASREGGDSRKARMEALASQSAQDRETVAGYRATFDLSMAGDSQSGASFSLDDMKGVHDAWWSPDTGLFLEASAIDADMIQQMAGVEAAWQAADKKYTDDVKPLLDDAETRRTAAATAVARIADIRSRMERYQQAYLALAEDDRGGPGAKQRVLDRIQALADRETTIQAAIAASRDAEDRILSARSNAERALYLGASGAYLRSLGQASASAAAMLAIDSNANAIKSDFETSRDAYNGKYPPGK